MSKFHEAVPDQATILRDGRWLTMDSHSIVPGDIIKVERGQRVPADIRVFETDEHCIFDTRMVTTRQPMKQIDIDLSSNTDLREDYLLSGNMAFLGYLCVEGWLVAGLLC